MSPSSFVGCHAGDLESYTLYKELFHPGECVGELEARSDSNAVIEGYHKGFKVGETKHITDMDVNKITTDLTDSAKSKVISTRIRVARNLAAFPLNPGGTKETRLAIIDLMEKVFATLEGTVSR